MVGNQGNGGKKTPGMVGSSGMGGNSGFGGSGRDGSSLAMADLVPRPWLGSGPQARAATQPQATLAETGTLAQVKLESQAVGATQALEILAGVVTQAQARLESQAAEELEFQGMEIQADSELRHTQGCSRR